MSVWPAHVNISSLFYSYEVRNHELMTRHKVCITVSPGRAGGFSKLKPLMFLVLLKVPRNLLDSLMSVISSHIYIYIYIYMR